MKRKTYRLLAMLLAFVLTFTATGTEVLAAGVEAGEAWTTEDAASAAEAGAESVAATQEEAKVPAAEGEEEAKVLEEGTKVMATEAEAESKDAAEIARSAEVEGSDADETDAEDVAKVDEADDVDAEDAPKIAENEGETMTEAGRSPRLRSFGMPRSLSLSGTGFSEGFEGSDIPEGWTLETDTEGYDWKTSSLDRHSGSRAACMPYHKNSDGETAWLITPTFDFSNGTGCLMLSFWYRNAIYDSKFEELSVCYRVSGGEWQELFKTESGHDNWIKAVTCLPEGAMKSGVEIGFKGVNHDCFGIYLDDVLLKEVEEIQYFDLTYHANGGAGTMTDANSPYYEGASVTALPNGFTAPNHKYFHSWNTKADGSGTTYYPDGSFEVTGNVTLYAQWTDAASGLNEGFEGGTGLPGGWTVIAGDDGKQWSVIEPNLFMDVHLGAQAVRMQNGTSWLITPSLDLRSTGNSWILCFWYSNSAINDLETYYRINGGEWKMLFQATAVNSDYTEQRILLPEEAMAENVEIGFKATCTVGFVLLDDVVLQRTETVVHTISISDDVTGGIVKTDKNFAEAGDTITLTVTPRGLAQLKTLTVKKGGTSISTTKVNETEYTFVMPDGNVTVDATFQLPEGMAFSEDFEGEELPGWTFVDADGDGYKWELYNGDIKSHSGTGILYSESYDNNFGPLTPDNWAITPGFTAPEAAALSFWIIGQDSNYPEEKMAVYVGQSPNVSDMVKVGGDYVGAAEYRQYFVDLSAYEGKKIYVGFRHYNVKDMFRLNLDDVMVVYGSKADISTLTFDENGGSGAQETLRFFSGQTSMVSCMFTAPEGKVFSGWNTKADGSGVSYSAGDSYMVTGDATLYAQWIDIIYREDFQGGAMPEGWVLWDADGDQENWNWGEVNGYGHASSGFLLSYSYYDGKALTPDNWAIMPAIVPSANSVLSFWIAGLDSSWSEEKMAVYVGSSTDVESMTKVGGDYTAAATYKKYEVDLSAYAGQEIYVAFRHYNVTDMFCIGLDDIMVTGDANAALKYSVTYDANGGSGAMTDPDSPYDKDTQATVMSNAFTAPEGERFASWNTKADGSGTTYQPGDRFAVTKSVRLYAQWEDVPIGLPTQLMEDFEDGVIPEGWTIESSSENYRWTVGTGDNNPQTGSHSGGKNALIRHLTSGLEAWLITPAMDLRGETDCILSFWYVNRKWGNDIDEFKACYRIAGGEWNELFHTEEAHDTWTKVTVRVPKEARSKGVEFGFHATDNYGRGIGLDDVEVKVYDEPVGVLTVKSAENGTAMADEEGIRSAGEDVILTIIPNDGYKLAEIKLTCDAGYPEIKKTGTGQYAFAMPASEVTVEAKFYAEAETYAYDLYVGGSRVTTANAGDVLGGGEASYDGISKTLTLKKDVTNAHGDAVSSEVNGLIIQTEKALTLTSGSNDAMELSGQTTIETNGLLTLKGAVDQGGYGIYAMADAIIRNSQMNVSGQWGLSAGSEAVITVENSVVTAQGLYGAANGIALKGCEVVAPAGCFLVRGNIMEDGRTIAKKATVSPVIEVTADKPYEEGFEKNGMPKDWMFIDADNDGYGWIKYSESDAARHAGEAVLASESYVQPDNALTPDNWAYLPALRLSENAELSFWLAAQSGNWMGDMLGVYVGTSLNPEDMTQLGEDFEAPAVCTEYKIDLREYAGQNIFIAFRHYNCTDRYQLNLDDVKVSVKPLTVDPPVVDVELPLTVRMGEFYYASLGGSYEVTGLPDWLRYDDAFREISGEPTEVGTYTFTLKATNSVGQTASRSYTVTVLPAAEPADVDAVATNLDGKVGLLFYVTMPDYVLADEGAYATLTLNTKDGDVTETQLVKNAPHSPKGSLDRWQFSYYVVAKQMHDKVTLNLYLSDGTRVPLTRKGEAVAETGYAYSVIDYCDLAIANSSNAKMVTLAKRLKAYGEMAQIYFDYRAEGLVPDADFEKDLFGGLAAYAEVTSGECPAGLVSSKPQGMVLILEEETTLRVNWKFETGADPNSYEYMIDDAPATLQHAGSDYFLAVKNISSKKLGDAHKFTISKDGKSYTWTGSALTWANTAVSKGGANAKNVGKALYLYNQAARDYFNY